MEIIVACMPCGCRAIATTEKVVRPFHMRVLMMLRVQLAHVKWYMGRVVVTCEGVILLNKLMTIVSVPLCTYLFQTADF